MYKSALVLCAGVMLISCQKQQEKNMNMPNKKQEVVESTLVTTVLRPAPQKTAQPVVGSTVRVHYTGWLAQTDNTPGREIDTSLKRGIPFEFVVGIGEVIKGFDEGVQLMHVGEKRRLIIPSSLGYGERGVGLFIPPNATLIFDIELLAVSK